MAPVRVIVTAPPYADFLAEVAAHPIVSGLRLNVVMPVADGPRAALERLAAFGVPLWVDLKGRQLRVTEAGVPPFTSIRVSHPVTVPVPCDAFFSDGLEHARVVAIKGHELILSDSPRRVVGPGESINIVHPDLRIEGTLTPTDRAYLAAMKELGLSKVMLSYVEHVEDIEEVEALLPGALVVCKIESARGLDAAPTLGRRLMAARGDLYVEVLRPHRIIGALRHIVRVDREAIAASRIMGSLARGDVPDCSDLTDTAFLLGLGYRTLMLGDEVCLQRDSVMAALNAIEAVAEELR